MNNESRVRPFLYPASACVALLLLGVAIAAAQNQVTKQAKTQPAGAQAQAKTDPSATSDGKSKSVRRGHALGMTVEAGDQGVVISKVEPGGAAAKAGFHEKDRIVSADHRQFKHPRQFEAYLSSHGGLPIPVVVQRDGQQQTIMYVPPFRSADSAWLGVFLEERDIPTNGAQINQIYPDGPAARAGLQPGDLITQVGDEKITNAADLIAAVAGMAPQTEAKFAVTRNEKKETIAVTLGSHHQQGVMPYNNPQHEDGSQPQVSTNGMDMIPPYAMRLEHDRRNAEQHQRIEEEIRALREEIHQLREELKQSKK
ncbi:MAG TPA: PDZ domain-containing protein [Planctomycetaceae bacterium]|jgi:S1-C subfamily serine protease